MFILRKQITLTKGKYLRLIPIGDIQGEEELHRFDHLVNVWCKKQEQAGHTVLLFGCGDYFETFSTSERARKAAANFHETTVDAIHNMVKAQADDFIRRLWPMRGKVLAMLQGHHWDTIKVGKTAMPSDQYIAESLGAEFAGDGMLLLDLLINGLPFRVLAMHGYGSARTGGARLNKRVGMREVVANANVYLMGHDNSKVADVREPLVVENGKLKYLKQIFSGIGCHQIGYHENKLEAGYVERLALPPASVGVVIVNVSVGERGGQRRLDYHLSV